MRNIGIGVYTIRLCDPPKLCEAKIRPVPRLHSRTTLFILDARSLISVARACSHARYIVHNLQNAPSDVSIAILRRGQSCTTVIINSWRKLIQDNNYDETLMHINRRRVACICRIAQYCNVSCTRITHADFHKCCKYFASTIIVLSYSDALF